MKDGWNKLANSCNSINKVRQQFLLSIEEVPACSPASYKMLYGTIPVPRFME